MNNLRRFIDAVKLLTEQIDDDTRLKFLYGRCMFLALALHNIAGWPIYVEVSSDERIIHAWATDNGKAVDMNGVHSTNFAEVEMQVLNMAKEMVQANRQYFGLGAKLTEAASRINRSGVIERARKLGYDEDITSQDIQQAYQNIVRSASFEGRLMVVYRSMNIEDPDWFANLAPNDNLGRYWAYDEHGAMVGSWDKPNVLFTALVSPADINWEMTVAQEITIGGEFEITLGGVRVILKSIRLLGQTPSIDFSPLYGKTFWT